MCHTRLLDTASGGLGSASHVCTASIVLIPSHCLGAGREMGTWGSMSGLALCTPPSWLSLVECCPLPSAPAATGAGFTLADHGAD